MQEPTGGETSAGPCSSASTARPFETSAALEEHLRVLEEAEKRDHRRLGRQLDLFSVHEEVGPGLVIWHPKGGRVRTIMQDYWHELHYRRGYDIIYSPHIGRSRLWQTSGHLDFYTESMYSPIDVDEQLYYMKPMNCPFHIMVYRSSFAQLPGAAPALRGAGHRVPLRAQRRAPRP